MRHLNSTYKDLLEVAKEIRKPLGYRDRLEGVLYTAEAIDDIVPMVKIGFSTKDNYQRIHDIEMRCKQAVARCSQSQIFKYAHRAEAIIHRYLAPLRRDRSGCDCGHDNREWFAERYDWAISIIIILQRWMACMPYDEEHNNLKPVWQGALYTWQMSLQSDNPLSLQELLSNGPNLTLTSFSPRIFLDQDTQVYHRAMSLSPQDRTISSRFRRLHRASTPRIGPIHRLTGKDRAKQQLRGRGFQTLISDYMHQGKPSKEAAVQHSSMITAPSHARPHEIQDMYVFSGNTEPEVWRKDKPAQLENDEWSGFLSSPRATDNERGEPASDSGVLDPDEEFYDAKDWHLDDYAIGRMPGQFEPYEVESCNQLPDRVWTILAQLFIQIWELLLGNRLSHTRRRLSLQSKSPDLPSSLPLSTRGSTESKRRSRRSLTTGQGYYRPLSVSAGAASSEPHRTSIDNDTTDSEILLAAREEFYSAGVSRSEPGLARSSLDNTTPVTPEMRLRDRENNNDHSGSWRFGTSGSTWSLGPLTPGSILDSPSNSRRNELLTNNASKDSFPVGNQSRILTHQDISISGSQYEDAIGGSLSVPTSTSSTTVTRPFQAHYGTGRRVLSDSYSPRLTRVGLAASAGESPPPFSAWRHRLSLSNIWGEDSDDVFLDRNPRATTKRWEI